MTHTGRGSSASSSIAFSKFLLRSTPKAFAAILLAMLMSVSTLIAQEAMPNFSTFPTGWTTDRYEPASMTNVGNYQGRSNVVAITIDASTNSSARPGGQQGTFYNTQGRKYTFSPTAPAGRTFSAELYIPAAWANETSGAARTDLWGTLVNPSDVITAYVTFGFTNYGGPARFRVWDSTAGAWVNLPTTVQYDAWNRFTYRLEPSGTINYFINGVLVHSDTDSGGATATKEVMLQAYNFADPLIAPPAASTAAYTAHWSKFSPALTQLVVRPSAQLDWVETEAAGGVVDFVADATAPSGAGALHMVTPNSTSAQTRYSRSVNVPLSSVTQASYFAKTVSGPPVAGPSYSLGVYLDGTPTSFTSFNFEPYWNTGGPLVVPQGVWHKWDVMSASSLWSSRTVNAGGACVTTAGSGGPPFYNLAAIKAACPNALVVSHSIYMGTFNANFDTEVDLVDFNGTVWDMEPDPTTVIVDDNSVECPTATHSTIQGGINAAAPGQIVQVCAGTYNEDVNVNKANLILQGAGVDLSTVVGPMGGDGNTILITAPGVTVDGFTITRAGNNTTDWGNTALNNQGVNVAASPNFTLQNSKLVGNRNGIYVGQSSHNAIIRRNVIDFNRTGVHLVDNNGAVIEENFITNNWTMGLLYRCEGCGVNPSPLTVRNNNISGNWYSEIEFREPAGSSLVNMSGNYLGTTAPTRVTTTSGEPPYYHPSNPYQVPAAYGGVGPLSVPPASHPTIAGPQSARVDYSPFLNSGVDAQPATPGFQGNFTNVTVNADSPQAFGLANNIQEGIGAAVAPGTVTALSGTYSGSVVINKAVALMGTPTITGAVSTSAAGATIAPGLSPGIINTGDLSLTSGSNVNVELLGTTPGTGHDQINVTGTVSLGNANLNVVQFAGTPPASYTIINNDGADPVLGTFNGLPNLASFVAFGNTFTINYGGGDGNDVVLTSTAVTCNVLTMGNVNTLRNVNVDVPINVDDTTGRGIISYDFSVQYDPTVITFVNTQNSGTLSSGMVNTTNVVSISPVLSQVNVSGFTTVPLTGSGVLLNLRFNAIGNIGTSSLVDITSFMFNNGPPCADFTDDGSVTIISGNVTGNISYGIDTAKPVASASLNAPGPPAVNATTDGCGDYVMSGFGPGSQTVTPSKSGDVNGITTFDAALIAQNVVGIVNPPYTPFNPARMAAADVSNDNFVNSFDAALIAQWIVLVPNPGITGTWRFTDPSTTYTNVEASTVNTDYLARLMGEVSGDWVPSGTCSSLHAAEQESVFKDEAVEVAVRDSVASEGSLVDIPVRISDLTGKGVIAYQFDVRYDPAVISPEEQSADVAATLSNGLHLVYNSPEPGLLKVGVFGVHPMEGDGVLINFRFNAVGGAGAKSDISLKGFTLNDGTIPVATVDGTVSIQSANSGEINGKVLTARGKKVSHAVIYLTDSAGRTVSSAANSFGNFRFSGVRLNDSYTLTVKARNLTFLPVQIATSDSVVSVDLIAQE